MVGIPRLKMLLFEVVIALLATRIAVLEAQQVISAESSRPSAVNWTAACINFPCKTTRDLFISSNRFKPINNIATRLQVHKGCIYVAYPRYLEGVPMTLGVSCQFSGCGATFDPFPCWTYQEEGNCDALQSVADFKIDHLGLMWVLDTGITNTMSNPTRQCGPKIVVINVKTKKVVRVIKLDALVTASSRLQYLLVDYTADGRCLAYVSDAATRAIIVYDVQAKRGYRLVLPQAVIKGGNKRDVLYIALLQCNGGKSRLYFSYLSGKKVYQIDAENLRSGNPKGKILEFGTKPEEMVWVGADGCYIYFRYAARPEVYRWSADSCFKQSNFNLIFESSHGLLTTQVVPDYEAKKMRALQSNFQDFIKREIGCGAKHQIADIQGCFHQA